VCRGRKALGIRKSVLKPTRMIVETDEYNERWRLYKTFINSLKNILLE